MNSQGIVQKIIAKWRDEGKLMHRFLLPLVTLLILSSVLSAFSPPASLNDTSSIPSANAQPASEIAATENGKMTITHEDRSFDIAFDLSNGIVRNATIYPQFNYIVFDLETSTTEDGELTVTFPRALIDAKTADLTADQQFTIVLDDYEVGYMEINSTDTGRTLTIAIPAGIAEVTIVGTQVVPEFPAIVPLIMAVSILSIIGFNRIARSSVAELLSS